MFPSDLEQLPAEHLEAELTTLAAHVHAGMYRFLVMVAEFDRPELYETWECTTTAQWLSWKCAIAARTAREQVRVARALEQLPLAAAAFGRGELSYAKVRAMARVAGVVAEDELMNLATAATAAQLERILGTFARYHERETKEPERRQRLSCEWDDDGMLRISGLLPPEDGAVVTAALAASAKQRRAAQRAAKRAAPEAEGGSAEPHPALGDFDPELMARANAEDLVDLARAAMG